MAKLTKSQREQKYAEARKLVRQGYTRRQTQAIIKEKYGETLHPRMYSRLYAERVATTEKRLEKLPAPKRRVEPRIVESVRRSTLLVPRYKRPAKSFSERFYQSLRNAGLNKLEAEALSAYWRRTKSPVNGRREHPPFLVEWVKGRKAMKEAHNIEARAKGWSPNKSNAEFAKKINAEYRRIDRKGGKEKAFIEWVKVPAKGNRPGYWKKVPWQINPWALKEYVMSTLPDQMKWDTPRHWVFSQPVQSFNAQRRFAKQDIQDKIKAFQRTKDRRGDPDGNLKWNIDDLQEKLKRGDY